MTLREGTVNVGYERRGSNAIQEFSLLYEYEFFHNSYRLDIIFKI